MGAEQGKAGYDFHLDMQNPRYALVAYVKSQLEEFVESLRRELHPDLPHLAAHLTLLPPRLLHGTESSAQPYGEPEWDYSTWSGSCRCVSRLRAVDPSPVSPEGVLEMLEKPLDRGFERDYNKYEQPKMY